MEDSEVRACARAFCVLRKALRRAGMQESKDPDRFGPTPNEINACSISPLKGLTPLFVKAAKNRALTDADDDLISANLDQVEASEANMECELDNVQQGAWWVEYYHWRRYYTPEKAAELLGVTRSRVSALIKDGKLDSMKVGSRRYIPGYSIERRLKAHEEVDDEELEDEE